MFLWMLLPLCLLRRSLWVNRYVSCYFYSLLVLDLTFVFQVDDGEPVGFPLWHEDTVLTCTCPQDTHISMISCLMLTYNSVDFETAVAVAASMRARWNGFFSYRLVCSSFHLHPDHILSAFPSERVCGEGKCSFGLEKCHCPPLLPSYAIVAAHLSAVRHLSATRLLSLGLNTPKESYDEVCCIRGLCWDWEGVGHTSRLLVRVHWRGYAPCQVVPLSVDLVVSEPFHVFVIAVFAGGFYVHPSIRRALERWLVDFGGSGEDAK